MIPTNEPLTRRKALAGLAGASISVLAPRPVAAPASLVTLPEPDLAAHSATALSRALRLHEITAEMLLDCFLERVRLLDPSLNAVTTINEAGARRRARAADAALDRDEVWGPLHGLPMTIKDTLAVAGLPQTAGSPLLKRYVPQQHAVAVARLVDAGAVVFGKTNVPTFADDVQTFNPIFGTTNNPWDKTRTPGGSSGGAAAALAACLTPLELGSDIGGSIRTPAHFCGVYGHKPSFGLVPFAGHIPPPPSLVRAPDLAVVGPMARTAEDLELALDILAGPHGDAARAWRLDLPPARHGELRAYRVAAWLDDADLPVDKGLRAVLENAIDALQHEGVPVDVGARPIDSLFDHHALYIELLSAVYGPFMPLGEFDEAVARAGGGPAGISSYQKAFAQGATTRHAQWLRADERRQKLRARWAGFFERFDILLCPATPTVAFPHTQDGSPLERTILINGRERPYLDLLAWAGPATVSYLPATVAPIGLTDTGLPVGIQIIAPFLEDRTAIDFARRLDAVIGGYRRPPAT